MLPCCTQVVFKPSDLERRPFADDDPAAHTELLLMGVFGLGHCVAEVICADWEGRVYHLDGWPTTQLPAWRAIPLADFEFQWPNVPLYRRV